MPSFVIDAARIAQLAATRQGRISVRGFHYQAAYAVARLASMQARRPVLDLDDVPVLLRYDWAEDLDEIDARGRTVFTQCKQSADIGQPARLAEVLVALAPKLLWTPPARRDDLRFRIVCPDPRFQANGPVPLAGNGARFAGTEVRDAIAARLDTEPSDRSDRSLWHREALDYGSEALASRLWESTEVLYVRDDAITHSPAGVTMLWAEQRALELLLAEGEIAAGHQGAALERLRSALHGNVIAFDPVSDAPAPLAPAAPRELTRADTHAVLFGFRTGEPGPRWFRVVERSFLEAEARKPKIEFVARPPEWADVIHGADAEIRFVERDSTDTLVRRLREHVLEPVALGRDSRLRITCVLGGPGSGKSTLARRAAALLVQENAVTVIDPGTNLPKLERAEADAVLADLAALAVEGRPVLLVLDDPFFAESGWDYFLQRLARRNLRVGVLAVSPDFLFDKFGQGVRSPDIALQTWTLPDPSPGERQELLRMHGRQGLSTTDAAFLVLAMEAAAGEAFAQIIARVWTTLNNGWPIDRFAHPRTLPWLVRAFLVTCYFHRLYERCPEALLRESLEYGNDEAPEDYAFYLRDLAISEGWRIFSVDEPGARLRRLSGRTIGAAHQRIAREAWNLRPGRAFDVADWVIPASIRARVAYDVGALARALVSEDAKEGAAFASRLAEAWGADPDVRTLELATLSGLLATGGMQPDALRLEPAFRKRAAEPSDESWLAVLQLWYFSSDSKEQRRFPAWIDLARHVEAADFSLAPSRLPQFLSALGPRSPHGEPVVQRLLMAFEGELPWRLDNMLTVSLLQNARPDQLTRPRLERCVRWLRQHPEDTYLRAKLLAMSRHLISADPRLCLEAVEGTARMLDAHHGDRSWFGVAGSARTAVAALRAAMAGAADPSVEATLSAAEQSVEEWYASVP